MPAERRGFDAETESIVYLDSSFVIAYQIKEDPHHTACSVLWDRLHAEGVLVVVSDTVYEEVAFHEIRTVLEEAARPLHIYWRNLLRSDSTAFDKALIRAESVRSHLETTTMSLPLLDTTRPRAFDLMRQFRLLPADAYHIAVALEHEVTSFVSLDADFLQVEGITVYTCI